MELAAWSASGTSAVRLMGQSRFMVSSWSHLRTIHGQDRRWESKLQKALFVVSAGHPDPSPSANILNIATYSEHCYL